MNERFKLKIAGVGTVTADFTAPDDEEINAGVVVAHGQANNLDHKLLTTFSAVLAERGYATLRFNFPYKEKGTNTPDDREILIKAYKTARDEIERRAPDSTVILAGKSLGARIAAAVAAEDGASGLIFLGYPIHRPDGEMRDYDDLLKIEAPILFFAGTKDPLCRMEKLQKILEEREHPSTLQTVADGDHSFEPPEGDATPLEMIYEEIAEVAADWMDENV